jgi:probable phosphoglycerate mutase
MTIFVARHAETVDNAARVIQLPGAPLSPKGRLQAERLAERVSALGVTRILTSDLVRAVETATCIAMRLGIEIEQDPVLRERDFGDLRGMPYAQLTLDPFALDYVPPQGESWAAFHERVALAWKRIQEAATGASGHLLVVTHGLVCRALAERHLTLSADETPPHRWENSSLTEIEAASPWLIRRLNCVAHLAAGDQQGQVA